MPWRDPLVLCLGAGGLLFAAYHAMDARRHPAIAYTPAIARAQAGEFEALTGRKPSPAEAAGLKADWIGDEILFREAIARQVPLTDPEIRKRLIDKERYRIAGAPADPGEEDLVNFYATHQDRYHAEPRTSFTQVYFAQMPRDPATTLAALNRGEAVKGDDFWMGSRLPAYGDSMVRGLFGQGLLDRLRAAPAGRWFGPVASARGWHYLRKEAQWPAARLSFAQARDQVRQDFMAEQARAAVEAALARLKERYDVADR